MGDRDLERETEDYERRRREDRVADHTPATSSELYGDRGRVATLPVLLGGLGHGRPWPDEGVAPVRVLRGAEDEPGEELLYRAHKFAPPLATVVVKFCAWDELSPPQAFAKAWDWLVERALPPPLPLKASDFECPATGDRLRHVEAVEAVLRRKLPGLHLTDEWIRQLAEECLAAADTGI